MLSTSVSEITSQVFKSRKPNIELGLYHYQREMNGIKYRIHLRIEAGGNATLIINANRIIHLNPTAALMAFLTLENTPENQAIKTLTAKYHISSKDAYNDYYQFSMQLTELIRPNGACPIHDLDIETSMPFSNTPLAPYRMDLALTYRCNNDCHHCYNARPRDYPELSTGEWYSIIDRIWDLGIPHVVFTGGEPTLRKDIPGLVQHAEEIGFITGLNTNGRRLCDKEYVNQLVKAGLDHIQITVESHDQQIHDSMVQAKGAWQQTIAGLMNVLETGLYIMTNTTMLCQNSPSLGDTLRFFAELGVSTVGLNALIYSGNGMTVGTGLKDDQLLPILDMAQDLTNKHGQRLIWYSPTQYCNFDPMQLELGVKGCTAALYNMCVEPDGGVIPCQSYYQQVGNLHTEPWESIWNHELCLHLRERRYAPQKCIDCSIFAECGGGCPLAMQVQASHITA